MNIAFFKESSSLYKVILQILIQLADQIYDAFRISWCFLRFPKLPTYIKHIHRVIYKKILLPSSCEIIDRIYFQNAQLLPKTDIAL